MIQKNIGFLFYKLLTIIIGIFLYTSYIQAQESLSLSGKIYRSYDRKAVDLGSVIVLEARKKASIGMDGSYIISGLEPGEYTVIINSPGLNRIQQKITISKNTKKDFYLSTSKIRGSTIKIEGKREIQKISRYTMTVEDLKEVPGSFGDSLTALTSLPGIMRTGGFLGPLIIRGMSDDYNRYYIDDIPVHTPYHFMGLHSIINSDLMKEIDVFSSAAPALYGQVNAAVISINTVDSVKEFGGHAEVNAFSSNALIQAPLYLKNPAPSYYSDEEDEKNKPKADGYWIVSGRYSYFSLIIPTVVEVLSDNQLEIVPEYYDYQAKGKYYINKDHSINILIMGSKDYIKAVDKRRTSTQLEAAEDGDDPLVFGAEFNMDSYYQGYGLYYHFHPSDRFKNSVITYASITNYHSHASLPKSFWLQDIYTDTKPYIFGVKDKVEWEWWENHSKLFTGITYEYYRFEMNSKDLMPKSFVYTSPDLNDPNLFDVIYTNKTTHNGLLQAYGENIFEFGGLKVVPGIRTDVTQRTKLQTTDYRGRVSYEFPTQTTISAAGGTYSSDLTINPYYFNTVPALAEKGDEHIKPTRGNHRVVGIEQQISLYTVKVEAFHNDYYDMLSTYPYCTDGSSPNSDSTCDTGEWRPGYYTGKWDVQGIEILFRKDREKGSKDFFGWISYSYSESKFTTGLPTNLDPDGNKWFDSYYDRRHSLKFIAGYIFGNHKFSAKFQLYTSFPYTPITGSTLDASYEATKNSIYPSRYIPEYGDLNSKRFDPSHQLDIRYTYSNFHEWGKISFYIELLNVYNHANKDNQAWLYNQPYSSSNPSITNSGGIFDSIVPNFGVEVKF